MAGDIGSSKHCRAIVHKALAELGGIDILVNNAAHQATFKSIEDISDEEWELTFRVNIHAMFYLTKAAVPQGAPIINRRRSTLTSPIRRSTMSEDTVVDFGKNVPMKRPWQPAELTTVCVMLADPLSSYVSGATIAVNRRKADPGGLFPGTLAAAKPGRCHREPRFSGI